jgi:hypothetical protein
MRIEFLTEMFAMTGCLYHDCWWPLDIVFAWVIGICWVCFDVTRWVRFSGAVRRSTCRQIEYLTEMIGGLYHDWWWPFDIVFALTIDYCVCCVWFVVTRWVRLVVFDLLSLICWVCFVVTRWVQFSGAVRRSGDGAEASSVLICSGDGAEASSVWKCVRRVLVSRLLLNRKMRLACTRSGTKECVVSRLLLIGKVCLFVSDPLGYDERMLFRVVVVAEGRPSPVRRERLRRHVWSGENGRRDERQVRSGRRCYQDALNHECDLSLISRPLLVYLYWGIQSSARHVLITQLPHCLLGVKLFKSRANAYLCVTCSWSSSWATCSQYD